MNKKFLALGLASMMVVTGVSSLTACGNTYDVGMITLHDSNSTYDKNFIDAMETACTNKSVTLGQRNGIAETDECTQAAEDLVDQGCKVVFADSFGHEDFMLGVAKEHSDVQFCHATGYKAASAGVKNYHNAFAAIYQGRYLAGVAAGMKLAEMKDQGTIKEANYDGDGNIKIGYVGAYTYAEVISGYTSWYLGVKSVISNVSMEVTFTGSWYDETAEKEGAERLISDGCAIISQHADSMGAPTACEKAGVPNVSYNGSTAASCPNTFIISSKINWVPYFEYMIDCVQNNKPIDTDWCGTMQGGSVEVTELGKAAAAGTQAKLDEVAAQLKNGSLQVFDVSTFTVKGEHLTSADEKYGKYIKDGAFRESAVELGFTSAPYFDINIDGITLLNSKY